MVNDSDPISAYRHALDALMLESPSDMSDRADIDGATAALFRILGRRSGASQAVRGSQLQILPAESAATRNLFVGLSLAEAAFQVLAQKADKEPMSAAYLIDALKEMGYQIDAELPTVSLSTALKRREVNKGDVVKVGHGIWALSQWYDDDKLRAIRHKMRTSDGMRAAKDRGMQVGVSLKLSEEEAKEFKYMVARRAKSYALQKRFNISAGSVTNYKNRLRNWNPGDPYPPPIEDIEDSDNDPSPDQLPLGPHVRIVK